MIEFTSADRQPLHKCLLNAYDKNSLEQMLLFSLDKRLGTLVSSSNLSQMIFELISVAERQGWVVELIIAAHKANPDNKALKQFAQRFMNGTSSDAPSEETQPQPPTTSRVTAIKSRNLEKQINDLMELYEAVSIQLAGTLSAADQIKLRNQLAQLEKEMADVEQEINNLAL